MDELADEMKATRQRLASLEQDARQPCLVMEADVPADKKTCELTESATTAIQVMHENSFSANRVNFDSESSTSFGDDSTGLPVFYS